MNSVVIQPSDLEFDFISMRVGSYFSLAYAIILDQLCHIYVHLWEQDLFTHGVELSYFIFHKINVWIHISHMLIMHTKIMYSWVQQNVYNQRLNNTYFSFVFGLWIFHADIMFVVNYSI